MNIATKAIKEAKRTFELKLANGVNKSFWAYVRSKTKTKTTVGPLQDQIGDLIEVFQRVKVLLTLTGIYFFFHRDNMEFVGA